MRNLAAAFFFALLLVTSCATSGGLFPRGPASLPDKAIGYTLDPAFTEHQVNLIQVAMDTWTRGTEYRVRWAEVQSYVDLRIVDANGRDAVPGHENLPYNFVGLEDAQHSTIYLVATLMTDDDLFRSIAVHELGHYLGLSHVPQDGNFYSSCMTPAVNPMCSADGLPLKDFAAYCDANSCD
jgi:hypothetical protein